MIDKLVLNIPFKDCFCIEVYNKKLERFNHVVPIRALPVTLCANECVVKRDGSIEIGSLRTKFESLPSSFSNMAMKIYNDGMNSDSYVSIKCSPSKLLQGHNVYGINCFKKSARNMLSLLAVSNPDLYSMLDVRFTEVAEFDLTYSAFVSNAKTKMMLLDYLTNVSQGQTKNRGSNYSTTCYFGAKNSRLKRLKIYSKHEEVINEISKLDARKDALKLSVLNAIEKTEFCKNAVRFEATLKKRYLQRQGIPCNLFDFIHYVEQNENFNQAMWQTAFDDIFKALEGQTIKMTNDDKIYSAIRAAHSTFNSSGVENLRSVNRIFSFYQTLKTLGYSHVKAVTTPRTFYRNIKELENSGFSRSFLQNLDKSSGASVIPIHRLVEIDFSVQHPPGYVESEDLECVRNIA